MLICIHFFKKLLEGLYDFYNFTPLSKWELTKSLTKEEISKILSIFPNSQIDLERDCQWVTLNTIIETIKLAFEGKQIQPILSK